MFNPNDLAAKVIGYTGGVAIMRVFGVDTRTYEWVKDFVKDEGIRKRISDLKEEIAKAKTLPIHKEELRAMFEERVRKINSFRIEQLQTHMGEVQNRQAPLFNELIMDNKLILGAKMYPFFMAFSSEDLLNIFSDLPEGVKQKDIDETVKHCQSEIEKLEGVIAKDLSPQSRWLHKDDGTPMPYPHGCRWTAFVHTWRKVASRFEGRVNVEGYALKSPAAEMAWGLLGLDAVAKVTPLREPY